MNEQEKENQKVAEVERLIESKMTCGLRHGVGVDTGGTWKGEKYSHDPLVYLVNDDDGHYIQYFKSREEIGVFIEQLQAVMNQAWPESPKS